MFQPPFGNGNSYPHKPSKPLQMFPEITVATMCDQNQVTGVKRIAILKNTCFFISYKGKVSPNVEDDLKDIFKEVH